MKYFFREICITFLFLLLGLALFFTFIAVEDHPLKKVEKQVYIIIHHAPDPFSVEELVKTHSELQKICDIVGGCDKVTVKCEKWDNTGNSVLRGDLEFTITTPDGVEGIAFRSSHGKNTLDAAIADWFAAEQINREENTKTIGSPTIYPNVVPCDKSCL